MKKKQKHVLKIIALIIVSLFSITIISGAGYFFAVTHSVTLNSDKLNQSFANNLKIFDTNNNLIKPANENYVNISNLKPHTISAFISAEDKRFYTHNGLDFIRIGGALLSNIKSKSFSEGASTISQQLVKNTHLTNEKTITRKLKEIKLTKQLEKKYSKNQILEMYLNFIYFGNGAYGIENASKHYFNKSAKDLTLSESALLAATINAPAIYDLENNSEKALERRNLILSSMKNNGKISAEEETQAKSEQIKLNITKQTSINYLYNSIINEACKILNVTENELKNSNISIHTYIDLSLQHQINKIINENYSNIDPNSNIGAIITNNKNNGIMAIYGNKQTLNSKKQPGSAIKPILVYAPAIENNIISPSTILIDEPINISGYAPENADKKFHGKVSAKEALKNSYNIPAVKLLNELGITKAQKFARKLNIDFSNQDNNLAIALGGMSEGTTLKTLCDSYSAFANNGYYSPSTYINAITKNGKKIFEKETNQTKVMNESTAFLITNMLLETSKTGTAKRLKDLNYQIASKTGTVGKQNSNSNTDAYNISYTSSHTILTYIGGNNLSSKINGATYPTMLTKDICKNLYSNITPSNFTTPNSVEKVKINKSKYLSGIIEATDENTNYEEMFFSKNNLPKHSSSLSTNLTVFNFENKKPILCFLQSPNYTYKIIRKNKNKEEVLSSFDNTKNAKSIKYIDNSAQKDEIYEYFLQITENFTNKIFYSKHTKLKCF